MPRLFDQKDKIVIAVMIPVKASLPLRHRVNILSALGAQRVARLGLAPPLGFFSRHRTGHPPPWTASWLGPGKKGVAG